MPKMLARREGDEAGVLRVHGEVLHVAHRRCQHRILDLLDEDRGLVAGSRPALFSTQEKTVRKQPQRTARNNRASANCEQRLDIAVFRTRQL